MAVTVIDFLFLLRPRAFGVLAVVAAFGVVRDDDLAAADFNFDGFLALDF